MSAHDGDPDQYIPNINRDIDQDVSESTRDLIVTDEGIEDTKKWIKSRTVLGIMGFFGFAVVYAMRVNLSIAIVAMVNSTAPVDNNNTLDVCQVPGNSSNTPTMKPGPFNWSEDEQGIVLGAFFYGYVLTQIPGGRMAELWGGKMIYGIGVLLTAVFTLLSPIAAYTNFKLFILVRILEGLGEGVTYPAMHAMLSRWIPPVERSKFAAYVYAGSNIGTVISLPISGWLCKLEWGGGWPLCFYLFGGLGVVWFALWMALVYDSPESHPRIDPDEVLYIQQSIGPQEDRQTTSIPWYKFLTCVPLWAILITQCGQSFQFYTQLTELPSYMNTILHFDIEANAFLSSLPYLTCWLFGLVVSVFADWLIKRHYISRLNSIKFWNTVASVVPSLGLLGVAWAGCDRNAVLALLTATGAFGGAVYAGNQMNHMDLSPQFAGTMYGITNAAGNVCGFLAPYIIGQIINQQETLGQWREVFYLAAAINLGSNLFYLLFASTDEQDWSKQRDPLDAIDDTPGHWPHDDRD